MSRAIPKVSAIVLVLVGLAGTTARGRQPAIDRSAEVDRVFQRWSASTPGCAVGVSVGGQPVLAKAYGMADLEHDVPNTPETIFEAGSVSKQFTAAAVLLLARDGKLSLDDSVRKHIPELPDYGQPLTIRHMLTHTSGLRDWGSLAAIAGAPRTSRVYTHAHVLEIVSRQQALNFMPGTRYSYSNTGYNLAAIIVARVSGMPFAEFTRLRLFEPLGLMHTSWRDDYGRLVKGRAMSYEDNAAGIRTLMPFENVHGNGGLLTTVGDLLKWNEHFGAPSIADAAFVSEQERPGRFNDGRAHGYALGLMVGMRKGVREVAHSGSTAGYRAHLSRYPEPRVSVAVLCNGSSAAATPYAGLVADLYLANRLEPTTVTAAHTLTASDADAVIGLYRNTQTGESLTIARADNGLRIARGPALVATSATRFVTEERDVFERKGPDAASLTDEYGTVDTFARVAAAAPTSAQLGEYAGVYVSDEAETSLTAAIDGASLVLKRRPDTTIRLTPLYADAFAGSIGTVIFRRETGRPEGGAPLGRVVAISIVQDRVWDLRFTRRPEGTRTSVGR